MWAQCNHMFYHLLLMLYKQVCLTLIINYHTFDLGFISLIYIYLCSMGYLIALCPYFQN